jgi:hypothetical protein
VSKDAGHELPDASRERRRRRSLTLALGVALLAVGLLLAMSQAAKQRTATNNVPALLGIGSAGGAETICQRPESIPSGTGGLRVALHGSSAPRLAMTISDGEGVRASGGAGARWDGASAVIVPLTTTLREDVTGSVCIRLLADESARYRLRGVLTSPSVSATRDGRHLRGRLHLEFLAGGERSWWSFAPTVVHRMSLGHAWSDWPVMLVASLLTLASIALGAWQLVRGNS